MLPVTSLNVTPRASPGCRRQALVVSLVEHFGKPFVAYVAEVRVGQACRLLLEDELGIAEIAERAGFNNLANFNRRFRLLKGVTPSEYRRMARTMSPAE